MSLHTTRQRSFDAHDLSFLEAMATTLGGALRQKRSEEQLLHQALHDPLTDLPNRACSRTVSATPWTERTATASTPQWRCWTSTTSRG